MPTRRPIRMWALSAVVLALGAIAPAAAAHTLDQAPYAYAAAVCADYPNQAAAQRAADTRDGDGDGIYCETLPCPCLKPGHGGGSKPAPTPTPEAKPKASCQRPAGVQPISFSKTKYPNIKRHIGYHVATAASPQSAIST